MIRRLALCVCWLLALDAALAAPAPTAQTTPPPSPSPEGSISLANSLGDLSGEGWRADGVTLTLDSPQAGRAAGTLHIARLTLPPPIGVLTRLGARCAALEYSRVRLHCKDGRIDPGPEGKGFRSLSGDIDYAIRDRALSLRLSADHATLGTLQLAGELDGSTWSATVAAEALPLAALLALLVNDEGSAASDALAIDGQLELELALTGEGNRYAARFRGNATQLAVSNTQGTIASDALALSFNGSARPASQESAIDFDVQLQAPRGEVYVEPIYVNLADHPGTVEASGRLSASTIDLDQLAVSLEQVITARSEGRVRLEQDRSRGRWRIHELPMTFDPMLMPGAYGVLLQPWLAGTDLDDLDTAGSLSGRARIVDDRLRDAQVTLQDLYAEDRGGRLAIYGLSGEIDRLDDGRPQPRWLAFEGGFLYGINFGAQRADFTPLSDDPGWRLTAPIDIPLLDGQLHLERLEVVPPPADSPEGTAPTIGLDASLTTIGMREIARAFGWPPLAGTLSGRIPSVTYENGDIAIAGTLEAQVFGGTITVNGLRMREPFGTRAVARADIEWQQLDLDELSSTFSFGRMNGRVDGYLKDLVLLNWSPLRFDAALYTSPGDRSRHRISQRAVDNIASLGGGGASAALSSSFLRFFEDFAYDELRFACQLQDGVCQMSGLEPMTGEDGQPGYLLLRGRGIPRLMVIGHSQRVDWPRLLAQLRSITAGEGDISVER